LGSLMITSSRACFQIPTLPPNRNTVCHSKSWRRSIDIRVRNNQGQLEKNSESPSSVFEHDALRKVMLLRWSVGAVGAGSLPGGAVGGARFGVLRLGEGRVPSRDYVGRGKVLVAGERGVEVGRRLVGRRRAGRRGNGRQRAGRRRVGRRRAVVLGGEGGAMLARFVNFI
jgi:hypothetical protein